MTFCPIYEIKERFRIKTLTYHSKEKKQHILSKVEFKDLILKTLL